MKKIYALVGATLLTGGIYAQSMSEDFESYGVGDYMGVASPDWTTWSGSTGGAEDVQVTDANASSGTKSIYFSTTASTGGPQDVVVPFGGEYNTGDFFFETDIFVDAGQGAYFNFQAESTIGAVWALNCSMIQDGSMVIDDGVSVLMTTTYPTDTWFTLTLDINLNTNDWEVLIDGVSQGVVQNEVNQVASLDLYPVNTNYGGNDLASYYIDDIQYTHTPYVLPAVNGAVTQIKDLNGLATQEVVPTVKIRNLGTTTITSFDLEVSYNGSTITENITGVSIASLEFYDVPFNDALTLVAGEKDLTATISNVNGAGADGDADDDTKTITLDPVVPAEGKVVVGEEGTGTWCGWCPRGAVFMDEMEDRYSAFWAGVAVHNGDPMVHEVYDAGMGALISGYPSGLVDRGSDLDPSGFEFDFLERVVIPPTAILTPGAFHNVATGELLISISSEFQMAATGTDFNLALVITEDSITGTGSGYSQANYYAGGGSGEMGGYESLPNPVPAADMVYDHVARTIMPDFDGASGVFPTSVSASDVVTESFVIAIPEEWNVDKLHIIGMLINTTTGRIDNACKSTVQEAIHNGYVGIEDEAVSAKVDLFPNPARDITTLAIGEATGENVSVKIFDINGKLVSERNYGEQNGELLLPLDVNYFGAGVYSVQITIGDKISTEKLVIE